MAQSTEERLVRLETLMERVLENVEKVDKRLETISKGFMEKEEHEEDIAKLKREINEINRKRWVQNTLSAVLGSVLTFLILYFLQNVGG